MEVLKCHSKPINCVKKSYQNNLFATGSDDSTIRIWDLRKRRSNKLIRGCFTNDPINCISFNPKNEYEISASTDNSIYSFDLRNNEIFINESRSYFSIVDDEINGLLYTHNGLDLLVGCDSGLIQLIKLYNISDNKSFNKHKNIIGNLSLNYSDDSNPIFLSCGFDCNIYLWNYETGKCLNCLSVKSLLPKDLAFNPPFVYNTDICGDNCIASIGDGSIGIYTIPNFKQIKRKVIFSQPCIEVRYIDDSRIISISKNRYISILNNELDILKSYEYFNDINMIEIYDNNSILIADTSNDLIYFPIEYQTITQERFNKSN